MNHTEILSACIIEAGDDLESGLAAFEYILSNKMDVALANHNQPAQPKPISAYFSHDINNRAAQGILNRSLKAARGLSAQARYDLTEAIKQGERDSGVAIIDFIAKYRLQLANLLTTTQLASLLEGAREVASKVPPLGEVPVEGLSVAEQEEIIKASAPTKPFTLPEPLEEGPDGIHLHTIDEAVKLLSEKNVIDRPGYDALDAAARAKAFTVANVAAEETLTKIRDSLAENVAEGADYGTWKDKVLQDVDAGTFLSDAHQEVVFRANVQSAFSDGQASVLSHPLVRSGFPYADYDAIHDDRARHNHLALETYGIQGTNTYRLDDPVFQTFRPPWDYSDRCSWTPITVRQAAEKGIKEAQEWLRTGVEPGDKAFVAMPPFQPPPGFQRAVGAAPLSIQLSMQSVETFSADGIMLGIRAGIGYGPKPPTPNGWIRITNGPKGGTRWAKIGSAIAAANALPTATPPAPVPTPTPITAPPVPPVSGPVPPPLASAAPTLPLPNFNRPGTVDYRIDKSVTDLLLGSQYTLQEIADFKYDLESSPSITDINLAAHQLGTSISRASSQQTIDNIIQEALRLSGHTGTAPMVTPPVPTIAPTPVGPPTPTPKKKLVSSSDHVDTQDLVEAELNKLGITAQAAISQYGLSGTILNTILPNTDGSVSNYDITRAFKNIWIEQSSTLLPPQFDGYGMGRKPNLAIPTEGRPTLTPDERVAISKYNSSMYKPLNAELRTTGNPPARYQKVHNNLQTAFAKVKDFPAPVQCYSMLNMNPADTKVFIAMMRASQATGTAYQEKGYRSTATSAPAANFPGNIEMQISAVNGLDVRPHSHNCHTPELLLNTNSQFSIKSINEVGGKWVISLDQLPPTKTAATGTATVVGTAPPVPTVTTTPAPAAPHTFKDPWGSSAVQDFLSGKIPMNTSTPHTGKEYTLLNAILKESGRSAKPQLLDQAGIDALKTQGWAIGFRSVRDKKYTDTFKHDDWYTEGGTGARVYGQGTYYTSDSNEDSAKSSSLIYGSNTMRMAIDPSLRSITYANITSMQANEKKKIDADQKAGLISWAEHKARQEVVDDTGILAALHNYDVIVCGSDYRVLLNRTKVAVQKDNV